MGGAFDLGIASEGLAFRIIEKAVTLRSRLTRIPYGDQAIFISRDLFQRIGGYREMPLMEDVDLMRRIKKGGHAISDSGEAEHLRPPLEQGRDGTMLRAELDDHAPLSLWSLSSKLAKFYPPQ